MGLSGTLNSMDGKLRGSADLSILATIAPPDERTQKKYDAMGLPDPVAFAALTALGAIRNPMAMLNEMMSKAQDTIEGRVSDGGNDRSALGSSEVYNKLPDEPPAPKSSFSMPQGKSFVEAFQELQQNVRREEPMEEQPSWGGWQDVSHQLSSQVKEAAEQAKIVVGRMRDVASIAHTGREGAGDSEAHAARVKDVSQFFVTGAEDEDVNLPAKPVGGPPTTLSGLLTGLRPPAGAIEPWGGMGADLGFSKSFTEQSALDKLCISGLPSETTESSLRLECARHGAVTSIVYQPEHRTAYISFATAEMAATSARKLTEKAGALGSKEPLEVRLLSQLPENVRLLAPPDPAQVEPINPNDLPDYLKPRKRSRSRKKRSRSRKRGRSRSRRRKSRSKSMVRWLDRSRSTSRPPDGQYIRATGYSSNVKWWEKKREPSPKRGSSSESSRTRRKKPKKEVAKPRQVGLKGMVAQLVLNGNSYYYNLLTGHTSWEKPHDDEGRSKSKTGMLL